MRSKPLSWWVSQYNVFCKPTICAHRPRIYLRLIFWCLSELWHGSLFNSCFPSPSRVDYAKAHLRQCQQHCTSWNRCTDCLAHPDVLADCVLAQNATKQNISIYILHTPIRVRSMTIHLLVHRKATWWDLYKAASVASSISTNAGDLSDDALLNCCCCCCCWWTNE